MTLTRYDLIDHLVRQMAFSKSTFGPGKRTNGVVDHMRKELSEVEKDPTDLEEWIDLVLLALDGAWRCAQTDTDVETAERVVDMLLYKLDKNEKRKWPDWKVVGQDKAIEHDRSGE